MRVGIGLLVLASLLLIGTAAYSYYAAKNRKDYTFYEPYSTPYIEPRISPGEIIAFIVIEHLLVGLGLACILKTS
jgi:hypothetical protein